jgi:hypothetical protein
MKGSDRGLISMHYLGICLRDRGKPRKPSIGIDPGQDLNPVPPDYEAGVKTTLPWIRSLFVKDLVGPQ